MVNNFFFPNGNAFRMRACVSTRTVKTCPGSGMNRAILKYELLLRAKAAVNAIRKLRPPVRLAHWPGVTLFISSLNTRFSLQLTIETLLHCTAHPNLRFLIGENASTDGSREYLESLRPQLAMEIIPANECRRHYEWLNEAAQRVQTEYWVAVDSDVLFLGSDWLAEMLVRMEREPNLYLLAAEMQSGGQAVNPATGQPILALERPSAWLMCVRTSLREKMAMDFGGKQWTDPNTGKLLACDVAGPLRNQMRELGLGCRAMPWWFLCQVHHFGNLSYGLKTRASAEYTEFKQHQLLDIERRAGRLGKLRGSEGATR